MWSQGFVRAHCRNDGASIALSSGPAGATACGTPNISTCTATARSPSRRQFDVHHAASLAWTSLLNGLGQSVVDTRPGDQVATVDDASGPKRDGGLGDRNHVHQQRLHHEQHLADVGTFSVTGSVTSPRVHHPTISCVVLNTCTLPVRVAPSPTPADPTSPTGQLRPSSAMRSRDRSRKCPTGWEHLGGPLGWWLNVRGRPWRQLRFEPDGDH